MGVLGRRNPAAVGSDPVIPGGMLAGVPLRAAVQGGLLDGLLLRRAGAPNGDAPGANPGAPAMPLAWLLRAAAGDLPQLPGRGVEEPVPEPRNSRRSAMIDRSVRMTC
jgi:hypothetical protein